MRRFWRAGDLMSLMSVALAVLVLVGSQGLAAERVSLRLNWVGQGSHAPFFLALERGYFTDAGLEVELLEGRGSATTVQLVGNGSNDFGWADAGTTIMACARGVPVKVISPLFQTSSFAVIALADSGIRSPQDLEGKRIAITSGDALSQLFPAFIKANNLDEKKIRLVHVDPPAKIGALVERRVDAILGGADDQPLTLKRMGFDVTLLRFSEYGTNTIGMAVIAHKNMLQRRPNVVRGFLSAVIRGWDDARRDSDAAVAAILRHIPEGDPVAMKSQLLTALTFLFSPNSNTLGKAPPEEWERTVALLSEYQGLPQGTRATDCYTDEFLPDNLPTR